MASTNAASYLILDFSVLIIICLIITAPAAKYCYHGFDVSSSDSPKSHTCSGGPISLSKTLLETDQETPEKDYYCFIFRYLAVPMINNDFQHESVHMEFGCDYNNLCHNKDIGKVHNQELVNGSHGQLFCCNTENCNKVSELPQLPAENRICYHGTDNKTEAMTAQKVSCSRPDIMCAKITTYLQDGQVESYFCDNDKVCQNIMLPGSFRSCYGLPVENVTQEFCCCDGNLCFVPPNAESKSVSVNIYSIVDTRIVAADKNNSWAQSGIVDTRIVNNVASEKDDKCALMGLVIVLVFVKCNCVVE